MLIALLGICSKEELEEEEAEEIEEQPSRALHIFLFWFESV